MSTTNEQDGWANAFKEAIGTVEPPQPKPRKEPPPKKKRTTGRWTAAQARELGPFKASDVVNWVLRYVDIDDVESKDAPGPEYWTVLQLARSNPAVKWEFVRTMLNKQIPTQPPQAQGMGNQDDGQSTEQLAESLLRAAKGEIPVSALSSKGSRTKPRLPQADPA